LLSTIGDSQVSEFKRIPHIPTSEKIADKIFSKLKKIKVESPRGSKKKRSDYSFHKTLYFRQFRVIFPDLDAELKRIADSFPILEDIHPFHRDLIDVLIGVEKLRTAISRITNTRKAISSIERDVNKKLGQSENADQSKRVRSEAIGRISSTLRNLKEPLEMLIEAKIQLSKVPDFNVFQKTIAFAGGPNAGKSSFVKLVSTGNPEIASYPFTTKELVCGHRKQGFEVIQLMDTPGLLDRPLNQRNTIEMRSILALKHLADYIIFLYDLTDEASLTADQQINLKNEIKNSFSEIPIQEFINKCDITNEKAIKELQEKIGNVKSIATIESHVNELEEIVNEISSKIPDKRFLRPKYMEPPKIVEEEFRKEKDNEIEWIFFDEDRED